MELCAVLTCIYNLWCSYFPPLLLSLSTGTFKLVIEFSEEYPNKPPTVRFSSKMFHPNGKILDTEY